MPEKSFEDLQLEYKVYTDSFKAGNLLDAEEFGLFLAVGMDFYRAWTRRGEEVYETFGRLAIRHQRALKGDVRERVQFCYDEAQYQLTLAANAESNIAESEHPETWRRNFEQNRTFAASWLRQGSLLAQPEAPAS